jgi:peptidyl-prolyl cis-trans isomerase C
MRQSHCPWLAAAVLALCGTPAFTQTPPPKPPTPPQTARENLAAPTGVAATVNGQPILEAAVQRGLERVPPDKRAQARPEILDFLIDNALIEQHLKQLSINVETKEIDKKIEDMKAEVKKQGKEFAKVLQDIKLTEAELREHITADLRWDKFALKEATEAKLRELFTANREMFDGSMVRARHILLVPPANDAQAGEKAVTQLKEFKKQIEAKVAEGLAKLPKTTDNLAREKARTTLLDDAFAAVAKEKSACPSKQQGGDVSWFQRAGFMVEPFSKTAFALKPFEMSDVVKTQFGYHLILVTDRKPGRDVKFEAVKDDVREIFCDRLRESIVSQVRQRSKIVITPAAR